MKHAKRNVLPLGQNEARCRQLAGLRRPGEAQERTNAGVPSEARVGLWDLVLRNHPDISDCRGPAVWGSP